MNKRLIFLFLSLCALNSNAQWTDPMSGPALNKDGSIVTGVLTATFDPANSVVPFPSSLLFTGTTDLTLNIPAADPTDFGDPIVAVNALDGFSTTEKWTTGFAAFPGQATAINPATVIPGQSVRVFQVTTASFVVVTSVVRELTPGVDYVAAAITNGIVAIIPLRPLPEYSSFMAILTNDIQDMDGNDATPDTTYFLTKRRTPWVDASGNSAYSLIDNATARALEPLRQMTQSMELNAAAFGIDTDDIILSWTVQTQSITPTLKALRSIAQPAPTQIVPTGLNTTAVGGIGLANIHIGIISMPYYSGIPSAQNPIAPLTAFWKAAPGGYLPPFDQFGLDPTSTNLSIANPFPVMTGTQTVPVLMTVPNGMSKPAGGWPVVIFGHGITRNRIDALGIADTLASIGYAMIAIDFPLHGISPDAQPELALFYIENTPFSPIANERTFDVDFISNTTGAPGPDGLIDASGAHAVSAGLSSMLTGRDTIRQGVVDLSTLAVSIPFIDLDGDSEPDTNGANIAYAGQSWGGIHGTIFTALEPTVTRSVLSVPGGGIARFAEASPAFGPVIRAGLKAAAGLEPGTADFETFLIAWQTVLDSADPINWAAEAAAFSPVMLHEVIGDSVIPNFVPTAPLSGTEPLIAVMGLTSYSTSQQNPDGLRAAARFVPPATHGSLLSPAQGSPAAFFEMQTQVASFIATGGGQIQVVDQSTMVPVAAIPRNIGLVGIGEVDSKTRKSKTSPISQPNPVRQKLESEPASRRTGDHYED